MSMTLWISPNAPGLTLPSACAAFPSFAFRIVTRRAADHIRKARRRRSGLAAFAAEPKAAAAEAVETIEAKASGNAVAAAIARLPGEQRAALSLFYLEDLSIAEIAAALGVPAGAVKTRLMAAREKLRDALGVTKEDIHEQA
jgi:RNA polymerase sigma-70 factor (ECF subfamily)